MKDSFKELFEDAKKIKCYRCGNIINLKPHFNKVYSGKCLVCKSHIYQKQLSQKEEEIRIVVG